MCVRVWGESTTYWFKCRVKKPSYMHRYHKRAYDNPNISNLTKKLLNGLSVSPPTIRNPRETSSEKTYMATHPATTYGENRYFCRQINKTWEVSNNGDEYKKVREWKRHNAARREMKTGKVARNCIPLWQLCGVLAMGPWTQFNFPTSQKIVCTYYTRCAKILQAG